MRSRIVAVTGTDTGVGKTIVAAAICAASESAGRTSTYVKAAQSGIQPGHPGDADEVRRLADPAMAVEAARYSPPLAPATAIRLGWRTAVPMSAVANRITALAATSDLVVVEGAGGILVELDDQGTTIADLAAAVGAELVIVARPGLGTLNHSALTREAAASRGLAALGVVLGSWARDPDLASRSNVAELRRIFRRHISGALPAGASELSPDVFRRLAPTWLGPELGGGFDARYFESRFAPGPCTRLRGTPNDD